jgi:hypothetical protein
MASMVSSPRSRSARAASMPAWRVKVVGRVCLEADSRHPAPTPRRVPSSMVPVCRWSGGGCPALGCSHAMKKPEPDPSRTVRGPRETTSGELGRRHRGVGRPRPQCNPYARYATGAIVASMMPRRRIDAARPMVAWWTGGVGRLRAEVRTRMAAAAAPPGVPPDRRGVVGLYSTATRDVHCCFHRCHIPAIP